MASETEKKKRSFRNSKKWKSFRHNCVVECGGKDVITGRKLLKGFSLHHMDLDPDNYENLDNKEHFACLNKLTHKMVHWIFPYYKKDKSIIKRLVEILEKMDKINSYK